MKILKKRYKRLIKGIAILMVILIAILFFYDNYSIANNKTVKDDLKKLNQIISSYNPDEIDHLLAEAQMKNCLPENKMDPRRIFARSAIIGDSMAEAIVDYRILDPSNVFAVRGKRLDSADELINKVYNFKPDKLFIEFGMNDITWHRGKVEPFIKNYTQVIHNFKRKLPNTDLCVVSIHKLDEKGIQENKYMENYLKYNEEMKHMCKRENIKYMNMPLLMGKNLEYEFDGLHPKEPYYSNWVNLMCSLILNKN